MRVHTTRIDLQRTRESWPADEPFAPALVRHKKGDATRFLVLDAPLTPDALPVWADNSRDVYLRIPLFCYELPYAVDLAMAHLLQLAVQGVNTLPKQVTDLHVVTGFPVDLVGLSGKNTAACLHYWFGIAVVLET
jgi:hypothetical protein